MNHRDESWEVGRLRNLNVFLLTSHDFHSSILPFSHSPILLPNIPRNVVRESINELWKKVFVAHDIAYSEDPATMKEVDGEALPRHGITRLPLELETAAVGLMPGFLFKPLDLTDIREHQPSEESLEAAQLMDYATHTNPKYRRDRVCGSGLAAQLAYL